MTWHVLHVRPRCEKKLAEYCEVLRLSHYLPLRSETKIYQRRKVTVAKPVFPGYVFAAFDRDERQALLKTNNIVRILETDRQRILLHQLAQIRRALRVDPALTALSSGSTRSARRICASWCSSTRCRSVSRIRTMLLVLSSDCRPSRSKATNT